MTRNSESRFSHLPGVEIERSKFSRPHQHKTTFNAGELIPIFVDPVLPGDTYSMDMSTLVRMSTPIFPTMDNAYLDTYFFFVPSRLVWEHWKEFNGENSTGYWTQQIEYQVPQLKVVEDNEYRGFDKGSIGDYFGIPTNVTGLSVDALPFRAYCLIWNEWFRDQNTMQPAYFTKSDTDVESKSRFFVSEQEGNEFDNILINALYGATPLPVCRYHDYFSSTLPQPQKGPAVDLPLYQDSIPVFTGTAHNPSDMTDIPLTFRDQSILESGYNFGLGISTGASSMDAVAYQTSDAIAPIQDFKLIPNNLYADVSNVAVATISQLRQAFQLQRLYEKDARGGKKSLCLHVKKIAEKIWKAFFYWLIRGEGLAQPQRIGNEIIFPRGRDTFCEKIC